VLPCLHDTIASWPPLIILQTFIVLVETTLAIVSLRELAIDRCYDAGFIHLYDNSRLRDNIGASHEDQQAGKLQRSSCNPSFHSCNSLPSFPLHSVTCAFRLIKDHLNENSHNHSARFINIFAASNVAKPVSRDNR